jgi:hypothetical protein
MLPLPFPLTITIESAGFIMDSRKIVYKETAVVAIGVAICVAIMLAVFALLGAFDRSVLLGGIIGGVLTVANFFFMALGVQRAMEKDPDDAKKSMRASSSGRMLGLFIVAVIGVVLDCFHTVAVLVPMLFPRIAIAIRPLWDKKMSVKEGEHEQ